VLLLHIIAYIVIGIVVGYFFARDAARAMPATIILGLVGAFAGGFLLHTHRYLSVVAAIIGALILGYLGKMLFARKA
jgi:uncharacterized membrane protein YeaQ/YmgE (transglycosylase-associated protein family)